LTRNENVSHTTKAAGYAIDELARVNGVSHIVARRADSGEDFSVIGETDRSAVARHAHGLGNRQTLATQEHGGINNCTSERKWNKIGVKSTDTHICILSSRDSNSRATQRENRHG